MKDKLPSHWVMSSLGAQLIRVKETVKPFEFPDHEFFYLGLENIESNTSQLVDAQVVPGKNIKSIKNRFQSGNILYGKLRPYLNKVYFSDLEGICSTDIWVFEAQPTIDIEFAFHYLRSPIVLNRVNQLAVGANLPRISTSAFDAIPIPVPPLPEQEQIVAILRQADELRRLRKQACDKTDTLLSAIFYEMFGDPAVNLHGWEVTTLGDLLEGTPQNGLYKHSSFYGKGVPIVRITDFYEGYLNDESTFSRLMVEPKELDKYSLTNGEILINRVNSVEFLGKSALVEGLSETTVFESNMMRLKLNKELAKPWYIVQFLNTDYAKQQMLRRAKLAVNQASINQQDVKSLEVPKPPTELMSRFEEIAKNHLEELGIIQHSEIVLNQLFDSILARAYSGDLTTVYRQQHQTELQEAAVQRDIALGLRGEEPRLVDFEQGRVTPEEEQQFKQEINEIMKPVVQEMADSLRITQNAAKTISSQYQSSLAKLADAIRPALPRYESLVNSSLAESIASVNRVNQQILASYYDVNEAIQPLAESVRRSQSLIQSLGKQILAIADAQIRQAAQQDPPQADRTIHDELDSKTRIVLQAVQALSTYFTSEDLNFLLIKYGHHFNNSQQTDLVQVEAALSMLEKLGFVRQVIVDEQLVYRLVDPIEDGALLPEELETVE